MSVEIIPNSRALLVKDEGLTLLAVSDLHLTNEDKSLSNELVQELKHLVEDYTIDKIIITGDLFTFGYGREVVDYFTKKVSNLSHLLILQGNHDPEEFQLFYTTENYCFCHGDYNPCKEDKVLIMGHTHPFFKNEPVFLKGELENGVKFYTLPPFNPIIAGPDVVSEQDFLAGFIFREELLKEFQIINLKGEEVKKVILN